jgi:hypothetical protein
MTAPIPLAAIAVRSRSILSRRSPAEIGATAGMETCRIVDNAFRSTFVLPKRLNRRRRLAFGARVYRHKPRPARGCGACSSCLPGAIEEDPIGKRKPPGWRVNRGEAGSARDGDQSLLYRSKARSHQVG